MLFSSVFEVYASGGIEFSMSDSEIKTNRLVTVNVFAKSDNRLCAATFDFKFDRSLIEFRKANSTDKDSKVKFNQLEDSVRVIFLKPYGIDVKNKTAIFSLTFKTIGKGKADIDYTVKECVNEDVEFMSIGNCSSGTINIYGNKSDILTEKNPASDKDKSDDKSGSSSKHTAENSVDEAGILNLNTIKNENSFFVGFVFACGFIIVILLSFSFGKSVGKDKKNKADENDKEGKDDKENKEN